jgi:hypothetical protein
VVRRADRSYYRDLLTLAHVDTILSATSVRAGDVSVVTDGGRTSIQELVAGKPGGGNGVQEALYERYRDGATIVLQFLHERWPSLRALCQALAAELSAGFQVNVYLTRRRPRDCVRITTFTTCSSSKPAARSTGASSTRRLSCRWATVPSVGRQSRRARPEVRSRVGRHDIHPARVAPRRRVRGVVLAASHRRRPSDHVGSGRPGRGCVVGRQGRSLSAVPSSRVRAGRGAAGAGA